MTRERLDALTGLRFLAAALILVHHSTFLRIPIPAYYFGQGVSLFFVLSGFILAYVYPRLDDWASVKRFLAFRVARIWPAHAVMLVIAAIALAMPVVNWRFLANLTMVQAWVPSEPWYFSFNAPSWSISTEFFFYLAFPLLIWQWGKTWWWKWSASAGLVIALVIIGKEAQLPNYLVGDGVTLHSLLYINPLGRLFEFVTGMATYSCFTWLRPRAGRIGPVWGSVTEIAVFALTAYFIIYNPILRYADQYFDVAVWREWLIHTGSVVIFPFLLITLGLGLGAVSRVLGSRPAILLGEISYSMYLVHLVVYSVYARYWLPAGAAADYRGWALCVAITIMIAFLIWKFIETPVRNSVKNRVGRAAGKHLLPLKSTLGVSAAWVKRL